MMNFDKFLLATKEVKVDHVTPDQDLGVILTVVIVDPDPDLIPEDMENILILDHTHDHGLAHEVDHLQYPEDRDPHLFLINGESQGIDGK